MDKGKKFTKAEAAEYLNCHENTIGNYIKDGILKAYSLPSGRCLIIFEEDLKKLLVEVKPKKSKEILYG